jgi:probable HAF family extracellular repeat protein
VVVGYTATVGNEVLHAFKWTLDGGMVDLGTLGGNDSYATGINNDGVIVGNNITADGMGLQGFAWSQAHGMVVLTSSRGYSQIGKVAANGTIAGFSYDAGGTGHAAIWTPANITTLTSVTPQRR